MKVVVHNPCAAGAFVRLPLMLSMMQERLDAGDEVVSIECDAAVPACVVTLDGDPAICRFCAVRAARGRGLLSRPIRVRQLSEFVPPHLATQVRSSRDSFASLAEFKALCHQGVDVGYAALSTYAHVTRDPEPDLSRRVVRDRLQRLVHTARLVHAAWQRVLAEERPDLVLMFNGRLDIDRPVLRACQAAGVPCHAYEVGMGVDAVTRFDNALPHDIGYLVRTIDALWQQAGPERAEVGAAFFQMRRAGTRSHR